MSAELIIRPGIEVPGMDEFVRTHDPFSIALDGYVLAPPGFVRTEAGPYLNMDHHTGVNRTATLSTCQQALRWVRGGLVTSFSRDGEYGPTVCANDPDHDTAFGWFIIQHAPDITEWLDLRRGRPLRNLVDMEGDLDATSGAYPYGAKMPRFRRLGWVFEPFTEFRSSGEIFNMDAGAYRDVIDQCCGRIALYLQGQAQQKRIDTRHQVIGGGSQWSMFREIGTEGRFGAFRKGIESFVIYKGQGPNGGHHYSIGRISEMLPFDVPRLLALINEVEGCPPGAAWGGSDTIGGSPRFAGSRLDPAALEATINEHIDDPYYQGVYLPA